MALKLNLGSGQHPAPGWVNVDKYGEPDVRCDLERFPWPWPDSSVDEVMLSHVLEHLGRDPDTFIGVMKELYRVCRGDARIRIRVPHPRHDHFLIDPTHVRPILPGTMALFSRRLNEQWAREKVANTPLALYHGVDFEIESHEFFLDEPYRSQLKSGQLSQAEVQALAEQRNNVVLEIRLVLRVVKPASG